MCTQAEKDFLMQTCNYYSVRYKNVNVYVLRGELYCNLRFPVPQINDVLTFRLPLCMFTALRDKVEYNVETLVKDITVVLDGEQVCQQ